MGIIPGVMLCRGRAAVASPTVQANYMTTGTVCWQVGHVQIHRRTKRGMHHADSNSITDSYDVYVSYA